MVVVRGPDEPMTVRRRDRVAGVWVNTTPPSFEGMPAYYFLASTEPLARIAPPQALARYGIGLQALTPSAVGSHHDPEPFRQAALRYHQRVGLYAESPGSVDFLSETLFRARVPVPAGVTRGQYNVEVYLFRDGEVVSAQSTPLFIDPTGLERRLFNLAHDPPLSYGLACVVHGDDAGLDLVVLFRRPTNGRCRDAARDGIDPVLPSM